VSLLVSPVFGVTLAKEAGAIDLTVGLHEALAKPMARCESLVVATLQNPLTPALSRRERESFYPNSLP
jgi:hypothetical protein